MKFNLKRLYLITTYSVKCFFQLMTLFLDSFFPWKPAALSQVVQNKLMLSQILEKSRSVSRDFWRTWLSRHVDTWALHFEIVSNMSFRSCAKCFVLELLQATFWQKFDSNANLSNSLCVKHVCFLLLYFVSTGTTNCKQSLLLCKYYQPDISDGCWPSYCLHTID